MFYKRLSVILALASTLSLANARDLSGFYISAGTGINATSFSSIQKYQKIGDITQIINWGDDITQMSSLDTGALSGFLGFPIQFGFGYRFNTNFAVELDGFHSGSQFLKTRINNLPYKEKNSQYYVSANAVGYIPLVKDYLYLKGKLGLAYGRNYMTGLRLGDYYAAANKVAPVMGVGLDYIMSDHLSLDLDYTTIGLFYPLRQRYMAPNGMKANVPDGLISNNFLLLNLIVRF